MAVFYLRRRIHFRSTSNHSLCSYFYMFAPLHFSACCLLFVVCFAKAPKLTPKNHGFISSSRTAGKPNASHRSSTTRKPGWAFMPTRNALLQLYGGKTEGAPRLWKRSVTGNSIYFCIQTAVFYLRDRIMGIGSGLALKPSIILTS